MRSYEERVAETKRRIAKIEREKRRRRNTVTMASAVAACLALLIGASLAMPGIAASIQTGDYSGFETAASIFHGGAALGYIVIGLLAFLLGVCVTVLCFRPSWAASAAALVYSTSWPPSSTASAMANARCVLPSPVCPIKSRFGLFWLNRAA
jgi:hypothetical protein